MIICLQIKVKCSSNQYYNFSFVWQGMPKSSKIQITNLQNVFTISQKEEVREEVDFLNVDKHKLFLQVGFITLSIKVCPKVILPSLLGMIKYFQITQSNNFVISLQCLKKDVDNGVHFLHADKYQSLYKLGLLFLMEAARYVESTKNQKFVIFSQYI